MLHRTAESEDVGLLAVIRLHGSGDVKLSGQLSSLHPIWNSEDPTFALDSAPIHVQTTELIVRFERPGAIVFRTEEKNRI